MFLLLREKFVIDNAGKRQKVYLVRIKAGVGGVPGIVGYKVVRMKAFCKLFYTQH
jgi:transcription antitermination factor NusA-like protein